MIQKEQYMLVRKNWLLDVLKWILGVVKYLEVVLPRDPRGEILAALDSPDFLRFHKGKELLEEGYRNIHRIETKEDRRTNDQLVFPELDQRDG